MPQADLKIWLNVQVRNPKQCVSFQGGSPFHCLHWESYLFTFFRRRGQWGDCISKVYYLRLHMVQMHQSSSSQGACKAECL